MALTKRYLGSSGFEITTVGFGSWAVGGGGWSYGWGPQDDAESIATCPMVHSTADADDIAPMIPCPDRVDAPARYNPAIGVDAAGRRFRNWAGVAAIPYEVPPLEPVKRVCVSGLAASR